MAARPTRLREAARRLAAGIVLTLAAGVGIGDDLQSRRDPRLGARALSFDLPHLGTTRVDVPRAAPTGVVLLLHRGGTTTERTALTDAIPWHVLLVDVDVARFTDATSRTCDAAAARLEDISRRAQRDAGLTRYLRPVIVSTTSALPMAAAAVAAASPDVLPAAVAVGRPVDSTAASCASGLRVTGEPRVPAATRWRYAASPLALGSPLENALRAAAREPARDGTPVQRWLRHFDLPLTAAWSSQPRGMLVLLSPARGWRGPEADVARQLSIAGVSVVGIDALQSFWQRRSPRDVALELQRLTDALASTGLPVYIGGREFGAETIAVAAEMMTSSRKIAGVVLVDPGPTAFFEVEPPALALRPTSPSDWSTRTAILGLERPTLCVTHAPASSSNLLCASLARRGHARLAETGRDATALAHTIASFILDR